MILFWLWNVTPDSVGVYHNGEDAVLYCMTVRDIQLQGTMFDSTEDINITEEVDHEE